MTAQIADVVERLEKAMGPDRELDREILFAIFPKDRVAVFDGVKHISTMTGRDGPWFQPLADRHDCPEYTSSTDMAMTLLPENWRVLRIEDLLMGRWDVELVEIHSRRSLSDGGSIFEHAEASGPTLPIALARASFRARSQP